MTARQLASPPARATPFFHWHEDAVLQSSPVSLDSYCHGRASLKV